MEILWYFLAIWLHDFPYKELGTICTQQTDGRTERHCLMLL